MVELVGSAADEPRGAVGPSRNAAAASPDTAGARALDAAELLNLWERGSAATPTTRACLLVWPAYPAPDWRTITATPVGQRNRALLQLWQATNGPQLDCRVDCPACGSQLELQLILADLLNIAAPSADDRLGTGLAGDEEPLELAVDAYVVRYRRLTSDDLFTVQAAAGVAEARSALLERCILGATRVTDAANFAAAEFSKDVLATDAKGVDLTAAELPEHIVAALGAALATADPLVDVVLRTTCAECGHVWSPFCDIPALIWGELDCLATITLDQVDMLAQRYGWHESDILALSPRRRQAYLAKLGAAGCETPPESGGGPPAEAAARPSSPGSSAGRWAR